ncbi:MAG: hypothetical protein DRN06_04220 [Thermoprotei archaeon]|nr:MAG: hypothetical protein DRN06_04220 [Thermoprotei archaeon]
MHRLLAEIACTLLLALMIASIYARQVSITSLMVSEIDVSLVRFVTRSRLFNVVFKVSEVWRVVEVYEKLFNETLSFKLLPALNLTLAPTPEGVRVYVRGWSGLVVPFVNISVSRIRGCELLEYGEGVAELGYVDLRMDYDSSDIYVIFACIERLYTFSLLAPENLVRHWYEWEGGLVRNESRVERVFLLVPHYRAPIEANFTVVEGALDVEEEPGTVAYLLGVEGGWVLVPRLPVPYNPPISKPRELFKYLICDLEGVGYALVVEVGG